MGHPDGQETIVAVGTAPGRGGIGVVRVSGPRALEVVGPGLRLRRPLAAGRVRVGEVVDPETGVALDECVVSYFAGPRSYTGEDVVEIAAHGAPVLLEAVVRACVRCGARLARAGEFTERAFLAGRIDLTQAEAVRDLIEASTLEQARVAARQLGGSLSRAVAPMKAALVWLIAGLEAGIDFAEDDLDTLPVGEIVGQIDAVIAPLGALAASYGYGRVVREGFSLAIVGRPNAGKSSLFNKLLGRERAIVTAAPGTTRDVVSERLSLGGIPVEIVDTAGLRDEPADEAERLGIERSGLAMADADVVLVVVDAAAPDLGLIESLAGRAVVVAWNKVDLAGEGGCRASGWSDPQAGDAEGWNTLTVVETSALTGVGLEELRGAIVAALGVAAPAGDALVTNLRQREALVAALDGLRVGRAAVVAGVPHEMVLLDLYDGLRGLDELTGATSAEDVLRLIFSTFCIGK